MAHTILIVDDSATTRAIIKRTLGMAGLDGATILEAGSGKAGLEVMRARQVDLVLADLHMPEMGGIEMTRHMRADAALRDVPVVVISAEPNVARLEELRAEGVRGIVRKPFTPEQIRDQVLDVIPTEAAHG